MFPLSGKLIDGAESYKWLINSIPNLNEEAVICSAFLKANILEEFHKLAPSNAKVKVLTRWQLGDLIVGASDLASYELCKKFNWDFYIRLNFHGKVFLIPDSGILVGSANATSSGFGLRPNSNAEVGTIVDQTNENVQIIKGLFEESICVNDQIFNNLKNVVDASEKDREKITWPKNILEIIEKTDYSKEKFFLSECFQSDGIDIFNLENLKSEGVISDLSLLGALSFDPSKKLLIELFINTKIFKWVYSTVKNNNGSLRFGGVTDALHNALFEDPAPYRSEVKKLVQNLYSWIRLAGPQSTGIEIYQPNHTEILRII